MKLFGGGSRNNGNPRKKQTGRKPRQTAGIPRAVSQPAPATDRPYATPAITGPGNLDAFSGGRQQAEGRRQTAGTHQPPAGRTAPKPSAGGRGNKTKTGKGGKAADRHRKKRRTILITVVVIMLLFVTAAAAAVAILVRPPEIKNDPTIKDPENGDKVNMSGMLNAGTRIDDVFTFVVGAVDEDQTRTDALMVGTMDTKAKTLNVMNIPRDTMCNNNEQEAWKKINAAYGTRKGIDQTKIEIERIMGFQPDKYVIVNFEGIAAIVDAIGGVEYEVPFRMEYDDPSQNLHIDLYAGNQTLDGKKTVEFLRWRHNNDYSVQYTNGDEGRVENQQKFLKAVAKQVLQLQNVPKIKELSNAVFENVKTDLTAGELLWMGMQAVQFDSNSIQFFTLPGYGQMSTAGTSLPLSFFFPYEKETLELVNKYFNPYEEPIAQLDIVSGPEGGAATHYSSDDPEENYVWGDTSVSITTTNNSGTGSGSKKKSSGSGKSSSGGSGNSSGRYDDSHDNDYDEDYSNSGSNDDDDYDDYDDYDNNDYDNDYDDTDHYGGSGGGYYDDEQDYADDEEYNGDDTGNDYENNDNNDDSGGDDYTDDNNYDDTTDPEEYTGDTSGDDDYSDYSDYSDDDSYTDDDYTDDDSSGGGYDDSDDSDYSDDGGSDDDSYSEGDPEG